MQGNILYKMPMKKSHKTQNVCTQHIPNTKLPTKENIQKKKKCMCTKFKYKTKL